jgi:demethylmenaquinone methyltransferase/2-methoxy-6-polyprenyl-1,4-benzoquinol methylase
MVRTMIRRGRSQDSQRRPFAAGETSSFGDRDVAAPEKAGLVRGVFANVASSYDLMNDLMSAGVHRIWKDRMVAALDPRAGQTILDLAGGTGDIAFRIHDRTDGRAHVAVCDLTEAMLRVGRDRATDRGLFDGLSWVTGDAESLPVKARGVDGVTMAFGLRNVTHIESVLAEAFRVLRPGGRFVILEFSEVVVPVLNRLYDAYSYTVLPQLGRLVAGDRESYQYLVESIRRFPPQDELAGMMRSAGFARVSYRNLSGGIAALHTGRRL